MLGNKKLNLIVTELFIVGRKLKFTMFLLHIFLAVSKKKVGENTTYIFIMKTPNKQVLQQIAFNDSSDIGYETFINA